MSIAYPERSRRRIGRLAALVGAAVVIATIIWVDIATGVWQQLVIVAGLAAGLVSFLLTVLVLDRVVERTAARRWAPVNRLALTEFLHVIADDERSEISRGVIVPRTLTAPRADLDAAALGDALHRLRESVVHERAALSDALSRWSPFLASSGDNQSVLLHIAEIALRFDRVRDATLEVEADPSDPHRRTALEHDVEACNRAVAALERELDARIERIPQPID